MNNNNNNNNNNDDDDDATMNLISNNAVVVPLKDGSSSTPKRHHHRRKSTIDSIKLDDDQLNALRPNVVYAAPLDMSRELRGYEAPVYAKSNEEKKFIRDAVKNAVVFEKLDDGLKRTLIDAFERTSARSGGEIFEQGDRGDYFYVVSDGAVKFEVDGEVVGTAGRGEVFGELALLYDAPRRWSCVALTDCVLWRVDQVTFRLIVASYKIAEDDETKDLLKRIDFLKDLDDDSLTRVAQLLGRNEFKRGEVLMKKGKVPSHFYIVVKGRLRSMDISVDDRELGDFEMGPGDSVGGPYVFQGRPMVANLVAMEDTTVLSMSREQFVKGCGNYEHLIRQSHDTRWLNHIIPIANLPKGNEGIISDLASVVVNIPYPKGYVFYARGDLVRPALFMVRSGAISVESSSEDGKKTKTIGPMNYFGEETFDGSLEDKVVAQNTVKVTKDAEVGVLDAKAVSEILGSVTKSDFPLCLKNIERHCVLSAGTFGRVWLVSRRGGGATDDEEAYALKVQDKRQLIDSKQVEGVIREKNIMASLDSPFVIKLVNAGQDEESVFMLTKLYQGGELTNVMFREEDGARSENAAKFYAANVLEGLSYMHHRRIVYRDLKPDNVLLDSEGYTVLVDLGFAKYVRDKTYTFCGTLLYLAPEVILQRGHNKAADHWSWGVLVYEMIYGSTPFYDEETDQLSMFKRIINQNYTFPSIGTQVVSDEAKDLIRRILVVDPVDRLGNFVDGAKNIEEHPWFSDVDFVKLRGKELTPPWVPAIDDAFDVSNFDDWNTSTAAGGSGGGGGGSSSPEGEDSKGRRRKPLTEEEQRLFRNF